MKSILERLKEVEARLEKLERIVGVLPPTESEMEAKLESYFLEKRAKSPKAHKLPSDLAEFQASLSDEEREEQEMEQEEYEDIKKWSGVETNGEDMEETTKFGLVIRSSDKSKRPLYFAGKDDRGRGLWSLHKGALVFSTLQGALEEAYLVSDHKKESYGSPEVEEIKI